MGLRTQLEGIVPLLDRLATGLQHVTAAASFLPAGGATTTTAAAPITQGTVTTSTARARNGVRTTSDPIIPDDQYVKPFGADGPLVLLSVLQTQGVETTLDIGRVSLLVYLYGGLIYPRRSGAKRAGGQSAGGGGGGGFADPSDRWFRDPRTGARRQRGITTTGSAGGADVSSDPRSGADRGRAGAASTVTAGEAAIVGAVDRLRQAVTAPNSDAGYRLRGEV